MVSLYLCPHFLTEYLEETRIIRPMVLDKQGSSSEGWLFLRDMAVRELEHVASARGATFVRVDQAAPHGECYFLSIISLVLFP